LPVYWDSSIFLVVDEGKSNLMRAVITGPKDTPYQDGLFEFDIFLPAQYPNVPPQVQLITTGHGKVRYNPNLYACG
ncbi:ubiquitin-conjugating enzyme/RWD-like protein, partial [Tribonema minus]